MDMVAETIELPRVRRGSKSLRYRGAFRHRTPQRAFISGRGACIEGAMPGCGSTVTGAFAVGAKENITSRASGTTVESVYGLSRRLIADDGTASRGRQ